MIKTNYLCLVVCLFTSTFSLAQYSTDIIGCNSILVESEKQTYGTLGVLELQIMPDVWKKIALQELLDRQAIFENLAVGVYKITMVDSASKKESKKSSSKTEGLQNLLEINYNSDPVIVDLNHASCRTEVIHQISSERMDEIKVFPNPTDRYIHIQYPKLGSDQIYHVMVYDVTGNVVSNRSLHGHNTQIDVSTYTPGLYSVLIYDQQNETKIFPVVVQPQ